jgi:hypothetical protein
MGGDYNCPLNPILDKHGGLEVENNRVIEQIVRLQHSLNLLDIWRVRNPNAGRYTWRRKNPVIQCRLDYYLVSESLQNVITEVDIIPGIMTDHSAIILNLKATELNQRGPGYWKFNSTLISNVEYCIMLKADIRTWLKEGNPSGDPRKIWEYVKYKIRYKTIQYCKQKAPTSRKEEFDLTREIEELEKQIESGETDYCIEEYAKKRQCLDSIINKWQRAQFFERKLNGMKKGKSKINNFLA